MSDDLLAKEKEFHRLNRELQLKMRDVMKEVDSIIHACAGNNLFSNKNQSHLDFTTKDVKVTEDVTLKLDKQRETSLMKTPEIASIENVTNIQSSSKKDNGLGNRAVTNLLKGKIDMLYKELQAMQFEYNKKVILKFAAYQDYNCIIAQYLHQYRALEIDIIKVCNFFDKKILKKAKLIV